MTKCQFHGRSRTVAQYVAAETDRLSHIHASRFRGAKEEFLRNAIEVSRDLALHQGDSPCRGRDRGSDGAERRDHVVSDRGPEASAIGIRRVVRPGNARAAADRFGVGTRDLEHGADERDARRKAPSGRDAGQPARPGAPSEPHQERLQQIVGVMGGRDEGAGVLACQSDEGGVSLASGDRFEISGLSSARHTHAGERKREPRGQRAGEVEIRGSKVLRAKIVQDVCDHQVRASGREAEGERGGIRAGRTGDQRAAVGVAHTRAAGK